MATIPGKIGSFEVLAALPPDEAGEVFLVRDANDAGHEALSTLVLLAPALAADASFRARFVAHAERSMRAASEVVLVPTLVGEHEGRPFVVHRHVHGVTLRQLLAGLHINGRRLAPEVACALAHKLASALDEVHDTPDEKGQPLELVHGAITSDRLLLGFDGRVCLTGFGVLRDLARPAADDARTLDARRYAAPEVLRGDPPDTRADVYSISLLVWEAIVMRRFIPGDAAPKPPSSFAPDCPSALDLVVLQSLEAEPDRRPLSLDELMHLLSLGVQVASRVRLDQVGPLASVVVGPELERGRVRLTPEVAAAFDRARPPLDPTALDALTLPILPETPRDFIEDLTRWARPAVGPRMSAPPPRAGKARSLPPPAKTEDYARPQLAGGSAADAAPEKPSNQRASMPPPPRAKTAPGAAGLPRPPGAPSAPRPAVAAKTAESAAQAFGAQSSATAPRPLAPSATSAGAKPLGTATPAKLPLSPAAAGMPARAPLAGSGTSAGARAPLAGSGTSAGARAPLAGSGTSAGARAPLAGSGTSAGARAPLAGSATSAAAKPAPSAPEAMGPVQAGALGATPRAPKKTLVGVLAPVAAEAPEASAPADPAAAPESAAASEPAVVAEPAAPIAPVEKVEASAPAAPAPSTPQERVAAKAAAPPKSVMVAPTLAAGKAATPKAPPGRAAPPRAASPAASSEPAAEAAPVAAPVYAPIPAPVAEPTETPSTARPASIPPPVPRPVSIPPPVPRPASLPPPAPGAEASPFGVAPSASNPFGIVAPAPAAAQLDLSGSTDWGDDPEGTGAAPLDALALDPRARSAPQAAALVSASAAGMGNPASAAGTNPGALAASASSQQGSAQGRGGRGLVVPVLLGFLVVVALGAGGYAVFGRRSAPSVASSGPAAAPPLAPTLAGGAPETAVAEPLALALDAGVDSGTDAGVDSGTDAGVDSGTDAGIDAALEAEMQPATTVAAVDESGSTNPRASSMRTARTSSSSRTSASTSTSAAAQPAMTAAASETPRASTSTTTAARPATPAMSTMAAEEEDLSFRERRRLRRAARRDE